MLETSKGMRIHISIFGRTNAGKSSFLNLLTGQDVSIVSDKRGTTTDAVQKAMELFPLGPILLTDTAGLDDNSELGIKRVKKTKSILDSTDVALIISDYDGWNEYEINLCNELKERNISFLPVITKSDLQKIDNEKLNLIKKYSEIFIETNFKDEKIIDKLNNALIKIIPDEVINQPKIFDGIIQSGDTVVLVIPIDKEAPKGRLILPQVQVLRELLDINAKSVVVKETELKNALDNLKNLPKLVITDSQAFGEVAEIVPENIFLSSFSIFFAKLKGDLKTFYDGAKFIDKLEDGDTVLVCESCTHHSIDDDIARVKIPKLIRNKTGKNINFEYKTGHDFDVNLKKYALVIHCGACMTNRKEILSRIVKCQKANVPISNYGLVIASCKGILNRSVEIFNLKS